MDPLLRYCGRLEAPRFRRASRGCGVAEAGVALVAPIGGRGAELALAYSDVAGHAFHCGCRDAPARRLFGRSRFLRLELLQRVAVPFTLRGRSWKRYWLRHVR